MPVFLLVPWLLHVLFALLLLAWATGGRLYYVFQPTLKKALCAIVLRKQQAKAVSAVCANNWTLFGFGDKQLAAAMHESKKLQMRSNKS